MLYLSEIVIASLSAMKTKSILYAIMSLLLSTFGQSAAKTPYYYFRTLDIKDGLSHNTVNTILQDRQGFMWFGTKDGLNQYDGLCIPYFSERELFFGQQLYHCPTRGCRRKYMGRGLIRASTSITPLIREIHPVRHSHRRYR